MRLYRIAVDGKPIVAAERAARLLPLPFPDMLTLIAGGSAALAEARAVLDNAAPEAGYALANAKLLAPLERPSKMLYSGVNYRSHGDDEPHMPLPQTPGCFAKLPSAIIGPGDAIVRPKGVEDLDYEVELAVIIGRAMRHVPPDEAMDYVFGYTVAHDVSARAWQFAEPAMNNITLGKNCDTFAPLGPCIVTRDAFKEPLALQVRTVLNGKVMQNANTRDWIFPLPTLLSFLAAKMTLEAGDVVTTGTPGGVGFALHPPVYLQPGDQVYVEVEGIGRLENPIVDEA